VGLILNLDVGLWRDWTNDVDVFGFVWFRDCERLVVENNSTNSSSIITSHDSGFHSGRDWQLLDRWICIEVLR
jgi:hypothetical protein